MKNLVIPTDLGIPTDMGHTLNVEYSAKGPGFNFTYPESKKDFPFTFAVISWAEWDRLVAWVELHRKCLALK